MTAKPHHLKFTTVVPGLSYQVINDTYSYSSQLASLQVQLISSSYRDANKWKERHLSNKQTILLQLDVNCGLFLHLFAK